jgi:hypothetical protein
MREIAKWGQRACQSVAWINTGSGDARNWLSQTQKHFEQQRWEESRQSALQALVESPLKMLRL